MEEEEEEEEEVVVVAAWFTGILLWTESKGSFVEWKTILEGQERELKVFHASSKSHHY